MFPVLNALSAYDDDIVLFTVPPDVFSDIKKINGTSSAPVHDDGEEYELGAWSDWLNISAPHPGNNSMSTSRTPIRLPITIQGAKIGRVGSIVDLAVQSSPELAVWATSANGISCTWTIATPNQAIKRMVDVEGGVHIMRAEDGDWAMSNRWPSQAR